MTRTRVAGGVRGAGAPGRPLDLEALADAALAEDVGDGDRTSEWTVPAAATGRARIVARAAGVVAGTGAAEAVFRRLDPDVEVTWIRGEGEDVDPGGHVATLAGPLRSLLTGERTALNFLARLSGIATLARRFVHAVEGTRCRITDTRKTTPGWRALEKAAVAAGGALNHRSGLYDMVLIKENHLRAAGGIGEALRAVRPGARREGLSVEVEVRTLEELERALAERPDLVLLDNMSPEAVRQAVRRVEERQGPRPLLEASGGVTLATVRAFAETGVDRISVGALTHSAPALDLSLLVDEASGRDEASAAGGSRGDDRSGDP